MELTPAFRIHDHSNLVCVNCSRKTADKRLDFTMEYFKIIQFLYHDEFCQSNQRLTILQEKSNLSIQIGMSGPSLADR